MSLGQHIVNTVSSDQLTLLEAAILYPDMPDHLSEAFNLRRRENVSDKVTWHLDENGKLWAAHWGYNGILLDVSGWIQESLSWERYDSINIWRDEIGHIRRVES